MAGYNEGMFRDAQTDGTALDPTEIPQTVSSVILKDAAKKSLALQLCNVFRMPSRSMRSPVLTSKASAFWMTGNTAAMRDEALKQTTHVGLGNIEIQAYEMAVVVRVPDAYQEDNSIDLFDLVKGEISEAIARNIDGAVFFGYNSPFAATHDGQSIYQRAVAAGNHSLLNTGSTDDVALQVGLSAQSLVRQGYNVAGFAVEPGFNWYLANARTSQGLNPYQPGQGIDGRIDSFYGMPMPVVDNGSWDSTRAHMIMGDFGKHAHLGIRSDLSWKIFDQGVINDAMGKVIWNAMQNDGHALRVTVRYGFATSNYTTSLSDRTVNYPFWVEQPSGAPAS